MYAVRRLRPILCVVVVLMVVVAVGTYFQHPQSPTHRAYRLCEECAALEPPDVDILIEQVATSNLNRDDALDLFRQQFAGQDGVRDCEPCARAVIDAARGEY